MEIVKLKELIRSGHRVLDTEENYDFEDLPMKGPAHVTAHIRINETGCRVSGNYEATLEEPCDRCTEPYLREIHDEFDERFVYDHYAEEYGGGERELDLADFFEVLSPEAELDLKDLIHQHLVMKMSTDRFCNGPQCTIQLSS